MGMVRHGVRVWRQPRRASSWGERGLGHDERSKGHRLQGHKEALQIAF
jgi:hypothetical protein